MSAERSSVSKDKDTEPIVVAENLRKYYRKGRQEVEVFRDLSFSVGRGEFVAIMGPSGSGKTTILNLIAGFDSPSEGQLTVCGCPVAQMSEAELARWRLRTVGFVFQSFNLISVLTAAENVEFPLRQVGLAAARRREQVDRALELVGLAKRRTHFPNELSGGEEQRVAIARAIVTDPELIVADEPTGNLDGEAAKRILSILSTLNEEQGKTVILVTHDESAARYARRKLSLRKGVLESDSAVADAS
jgi:putative ABC transport system ATP-binding protein